MGDKEWEMSPRGLPRIISMHCCSAMASPLELKVVLLFTPGSCYSDNTKRAERGCSCHCMKDWNFITLSSSSSSLDFEKQHHHGISLKREKTKEGKKNKMSSGLFRTMKEYLKKKEREGEKYNVFNHSNLKCQAYKASKELNIIIQQLPVIQLFNVKTPSCILLTRK